MDECQQQQQQRPARVEIIITEAQTPAETENYWEKEEYQNQVELQEARKEAQAIVSEVISQATELVQRKKARPDEEMRRADPELMETARRFVRDILDKALEEANRRKRELHNKKSGGGSRSALETLDAESSSGDERRKPWYGGASTSLCRFFQRVCMCLCGRQDR